MVAFPSPDPHLGHSARETRSACPDEDYLLQVSLTIFKLVAPRSAYSSDSDVDIAGFLDPSSHYTSNCGLWAEEIGMSGR